MSSFSWLYIGLGIVLGFIILGIVAELYHLQWRNNKRINTTTEVEDNKTHPLHPIREITINPREIRHGFDLELCCSEDLPLKTEEQEEDEDLELKAIYNLAGQPRFLFTIKEETNEDLESEDAKSRDDRRSRNRSLSDVITAIETPFFTPMASPLSSYKLHGFNPLFESSAELDQNLNGFRSSPPSKFKFLRDAEEKLYRRLMEEAQTRTELNEREGPVMKQSINQAILLA